MPDDKPLRCDCGYRATAIDEAGLIAEIRRHAREAHGVEFTVEDALLVPPAGGARPVSGVIANRHVRRARAGRRFDMKRLIGARLSGKESR